MKGGMEAVVAPRGTSAITAKQELGKTKGVPKRELGNERKILGIFGDRGKQRKRGRDSLCH
ncbi:MAG: hypothetical protein ABSA09_05990 [Desulfobaccales bacterium]|jgi:hypothetical protein